MRWTVETFDGVDAEIEALPPGHRPASSVLWKLSKLSEQPHVKLLEGKLWELRAKASQGIARGIYVTVTDRCVVIRACSGAPTHETGEP